MENFNDLNLHDSLRKSLAHMKYNKPTPIQAKAIPVAMKGNDVMGSAQTGTGKTAAFAIPLVEKLLRSPNGTALVLTPTRELGKQIMGIMHQLLGPKSPIKTAFIIGGEPMGKQYSQLRANPRLIVGTPGRINDHLKRGSLDLSDTNFLVLDETDRMLDMGFSIQLDEIFKFMPKERQSLMFSATLPDDIIRMSQKYLNNPVRVAVGSTIAPAKNITQDIIRVNDDTKYPTLVEQLEMRTGSVVIFVKTKRGADKLAKRLSTLDFKADAIHGDLRQSKRERVIRNFRNMKFRILVATDVVARGLDIPHIQHVINYDLPQVPEDYIHRIGRTARAGAEGYALCLISPKDNRKWHAIQQLIDPEARHDMPPRDRKDKKPNRRTRNGGQGYKGKKRRSSANNNEPRHGDARRDEQHSNGAPQKKKASGGGYKGKKSAGKTVGKSGGKPAHRGKPNSGKPQGKKSTGKKNFHGGTAGKSQQNRKSNKPRRAA